MKLNIRYAVHQDDGMKGTIEALKDAEVRDSVKVIVGGAPVNQRFAGEIGADGCAADATTTADIAKKLVVEALVKPV